MDYLNYVRFIFYPRSSWNWTGVQCWVFVADHNTVENWVFPRNCYHIHFKPADNSGHNTLF